MIKLGVLHAYEHTEAFVREVCTKIFAERSQRKYNIIMECAFDSLDFAAFPPTATAAGYQFETHIVGCNQEFAHVSSIKRALKSLEKQEMERFVTVSTLDASMSYAQAIILAFETACKAVSGSQITLYERGFGALKERALRAQSTYTKTADDNRCIYHQGKRLLLQCLCQHHRLTTSTPLSDRDEMVKNVTWRCSKPRPTPNRCLTLSTTTCTPTSPNT